MITLTPGSWAVRLVFLAAGAALGSGCGPVGQLTMGQGDYTPDVLMLAVVSTLRDTETDAWLGQLPSREQIVAKARKHAAGGSGATMRATGHVIAGGGESAYKRHKKKVGRHLRICKKFLQEQGIGREVDVLVRGLIMGRPWKLDWAPAYRFKETPEIELVAGETHVFLTVSRDQYEDQWRLLGCVPLGFVQVEEQGLSIGLCFTPPGYNSRRSRPSDSYTLGKFGELDVPSRPGFVMEFRYRADGTVPDPRRLVVLHRGYIGLLGNSFFISTNQVLDEGQPVTFAPDSDVFQSIKSDMAVTLETFERLRKQGVADYRLRELELHNNLRLIGISLRSY